MQKNYGQIALKKPVAVEEIERKSRTLQDHIYGNRYSNPLMLDVCYKHLLPKNEVKMNRSVKEFADEALERLGKTNNPS
jgi:hypothetical protein